MAFDITTFFVGRMLAEREGADTQAANRAGLIGSYLGGLTAVNLLVVREFARRQIPAPAPQLPAPPPPPGGDPRIPVLEAAVQGLAAGQEELKKQVIAAQDRVDDLHEGLCNLPIGLVRLAMVTSALRPDGKGVSIEQFAQNPDPDTAARLCDALTGTPNMDEFTATINELFEPPVKAEP